MFTLSKATISTHLPKKCYSVFGAAQILSEENKRKTVEKFAKTRSVKTRAPLPAKAAAVLIPLCLVDDKVSLLYTLRAPNLKSHRGQVSFPGGMQDSADRTLEATALRETQEELGLDSDQIEIWGTGAPFVSNEVTKVTPVIAVIKARDLRHCLKINPHEVKEVFTVTLEDLCDPAKIGHTQFRAKYSVPVFLGGKRRIWGLTAVITHQFLNALLPKDLYNHHVKNVTTRNVPPSRLF